MERRLRHVAAALAPTTTAAHPSPPPWHPSFPPRELALRGDHAATAAWLSAHTPTMKLPDPTTTPRERELATMSAGEYISARRAGEVTCEEYARCLTQRAAHYSYLNAFMYQDSMPQQFDVIVEQAIALDRRAAAAGDVEAIAPLYGLLVPAKGTMATTDFPSSAGSGALHDCFATQDAAFVALLRQKNAVIMGKTNVPEFAASGVSANYANGRTINPHDHRLIPGGSSGGGGVAVAAHLAAVAVTEDTGGSTRLPAFFNGNFGYDPSRNHYPNAGNPGMTYTNDQIGLNARSLDDILIVDAALLDLQPEHAAAAAAMPPPSEIRCGLPQWPFVEFTVPAGCVDSMDVGSGLRVSDALEAKYLHCSQVLGRGGVAMVASEWADVDATHSSGSGGQNKLNRLADILIGRVVNGKPLDTGLSNAVHSFSGQIAEWVSTYLEADVSLSAIIADTHPCGAAHNPASFMKRPMETDETQFRYISALQAETIEVYNSLFDDYNLDVIMIPVVLGDACTYEDMAQDTCPLKRRAVDGEGWVDSIGSYWLSMYTNMNTLKNIPIPKLVVPTGLDDQGRPTAVQLWGRALPVAHLYDDAFARTYDLEFLYTAKAMVGLIQAEPALARVEPALVADLA